MKEGVQVHTTADDDGTALLKSVHVRWVDGRVRIEVAYWRDWKTQVFYVDENHQKYSIHNDCRVCCKELNSQKAALLMAEEGK